MIQNILEKPKPSWQQSLIEVITSPEELFELLHLQDETKLQAAKQATELFGLRVPREFISKIQPGNWDDPILKQILPIYEETQITPGYNTDPLHEIEFNPIPGLLHKYGNRVLLTVTSACGINCRYCFRRHFAYDENHASRNIGRQRIINYLKNKPEINEIIYSGGDPLLADDEYLAELTNDIMQLPQIKRLRIHSRLPIVIPDRINVKFVDWFSNSRWQSILVTHCNHPQELDDTLKDKINFLKAYGITVLNQSVLLHGINDQVETLVELSEKLFACGILPYYLHTLDKVAGAAHFNVNEARAKELHLEIQKKLPGFLVPKLAKEQPGAAHKVLL